MSFTDRGGGAETEYFVPTGLGEGEFTEKRSRFIGRVFPVETQEQAKACIESVKKEHYDARHHCWCYLLRETGVQRYSDDGEPQGTAGQPMLEVFRREQVTNICCVVTRYFGGILLGAGGLLRAYTRGAKCGLEAAGISVVRRWRSVVVPCPYSLLERVKLEILACDGVVGEVEYAAQVRVHALLLEGKVNHFTLRMTELSGGSSVLEQLGEVDRAAPRA